MYRLTAESTIPFFSDFDFSGADLTYFVAMEQAVLLMESGGTKTDVAALLNGKLLWRKTLPSLHPRTWLTTDWQQWSPKALWTDYDGPVQLHFYGAGCNRPEAKMELTDYLLDLGYAHLSVHSDLEAAVKALSDESPKHIAILGTGSVFLEQAAGAWTHRGGLGFEKGDEGSGAHFGRMVIQAFLASELSDEQMKQVEILGMSELDSNHIECCKRVAFGLGESTLFNELHKKNVKAFFSMTIGESIKELETLHFVGGYAAHIEALLSNTCEEFGIQLGRIIEKPMDVLIQKYLNR